MLPRPRQRSIFHLGEEGGDDHQQGAGAEHVKSIDAGARHNQGRRDHRRQRRERDAAVDAAGVGLQILVQHRHHVRAPSSSRSHIVLKQVVLPTAARRHRRGPCGSFLLRACSLCRRELSPNKDVYMYRGDQGFCSEECRRQQMVIDEAREGEAMVKKERMRRGLPHHHLHHGPRPAAAAAIRGALRRLVAVAY